MVIVFFQSKQRYAGARMQRARSMQTHVKARRRQTGRR